MVKNLLLIFLLSLSARANQSCYNKEESASYFYVNGIWNSPNESQEGAKLIRNKFLIVKDVVELYNESEGPIDDIFEVFNQVDIEKFKKINPISKKSLIDKPDHLVKKMLNSLNKDKQNYVFAHSQGTLYANAMCDLKEEALNLDIVAIAPAVNELKCNNLDKYALFGNDRVISLLNLNLKKTHDGGKFNLLNHTLEEYLSRPDVVSYLKNKLDQAQEENYEKVYGSMLMGELKIKEKGLLEKASSQIENASDSISLWIREKKAMASTVQYIASVADIENLKSKEGIKKVLNTPIPAENEQELADMIAYSINALNTICKNNFPKELRPYCSKVEIKDYFNNKQEFKPYMNVLTFSDSLFKFTCSNVVAFYDQDQKELDVDLNYQKTPLTISFNDTDYEIPEQAFPVDPIKSPIGSITFSKEDLKYMAQFNFEAPTVKLERKALAFKDKFKDCNTLNKIGSKGCRDFLKNLEREYFTQK